MNKDIKENKYKNEIELGVVKKINVSMNKISITKVFPEINIKGVIIVKKLHYIEIWNAEKKTNLRQMIIQKLLLAQTPEEKIKYQTALNKLSILIVDGYRKIQTHPKCKNYKFICLEEEIVERYNLRNEAILEGMGEYIRIWNSHKFEMYQNEKKRRNTEKLFFEKMKIRQLKK